MDFKVEGNALWQELHWMEDLVRFLRAINKNLDPSPCAVHRHALFFIDSREVFMQALIMAISRITDKGGQKRSLGNVFRDAFEQPPKDLNIKKLEEAKKFYELILVSAPLKAIRKIRTTQYAHTLPDKLLPDGKIFENITWAELYETSEKLQEVYNIAAASGLWPPSPFNGGPVYVQAVAGFRTIEDDISSMFHQLEQACHSDQLHKRFGKNENPKNE